MCVAFGLYALADTLEGLGWRCRCGLHQVLKDLHAISRLWLPSPSVEEVPGTPASERLAVGGKSQHPHEETLFGKAAAETFMCFQKLGQ